jgi:hypothetical protein
MLAYFALVVKVEHRGGVDFVAWLPFKERSTELLYNVQV